MTHPLLRVATRAHSLSLLLALTATACGGKVIIDAEDGGGGTGGTDTVTSSTTGPTTSTTTTSTTTSSTTTSSSTSTTTPTTTETVGATLVEVPLGTIPLNSGFKFDVPSNALGFTIVAQPANGTNDLTIGIDSLWAPDGTQLVANYSLGPEDQYFTYANIGIIAASVPQSSDPQAMPVQPGTWTGNVSNYDGGGGPNADVKVWVRETVDGQFHGGVMDVNVFIAGNAISIPQLNDVLKESYSDYAGITLGNVTVHPLPDEFAVVDENNFYQTFNQTSVISDKPALNLIYVVALTGQLDGAAGVSSGLPGVAIQHGTNASGVIATFFNDPFDSIILRHEGGHFGGLVHTSEFEPPNGDYLSDTPLCEDVLAIFDGCPDYDNIMFPTGGLGAVFSPQQIQVLRGSALYRGVFQPGAAPAKPFLIKPASGDTTPNADVTDDNSDPGIQPASSAPKFTSPAAAPWASTLPSGAAAALSGLVCAQGPGGLSAAWNNTLTTLAPVSDAALVALAQDAGVPNQARTHAVQALAARNIKAATVSAIADIAANPTAPNVVRAAAISAISRQNAATRAALKVRFDASTPKAVAVAAARLL